MISVLRGGSGFVPKADTVVEAGDEVLVVLDPGIEDDITAIFVGENGAVTTAKAPFPYHSQTRRISPSPERSPRALPANKGHPSALGPVGNGGASGRRSVPSPGRAATAALPRGLRAQAV